MEPGYLILYASCYFGLFTAILFFLSFFENKDKLGNPPLRRYPTVTIAIPAYNEEKTIAATFWRSSSPDAVRISDPNWRTTWASPGVPGATTSRASVSLSIVATPSFSSRART